ncbi:MAG: hypothetical protein WC915_05730 [archaeon]|jgi:hypothetical protein
MPNPKWERRIQNGKIIDALIGKNQHHEAILLLNQAHDQLVQRAQRTKLFSYKFKGPERERLIKLAKADAKKAIEIQKFLNG